MAERYKAAIEKVIHAGRQDALIWPARRAVPVAHGLSASGHSSKWILPSAVYL